jgi:hypothetical protein
VNKSSPATAFRKSENYLVRFVYLQLQFKKTVQHIQRPPKFNKALLKQNVRDT